MKILSDMYYGNICPCDKEINAGSELEKLQYKLAELSDELVKELTVKQIELFEEIMSCWGEINTLTGEEYFTDGFKIGARIIMEINEK